MKFVYPALLGFALFGLTRVEAGTCDAVVQARHVATTYRAPTVVKKVVAEEVVFVRYLAVIPLLDLPTYSASFVQTPPVVAAPSYAPAAPPGQAVGAAPSNDLRQILELMRGMDARIQRLEAVRPVGGATALPPAALPNPASAPNAPASPGLRVMAAKCASCHESAVAATKGGGLKLFDGVALATLTDRQIRRTMSVVQKGSMPPRESGIAPLTDEEAAAVFDLFDKK